MDLGSASSMPPHLHNDNNNNGVLHLSNGAIITLIVMVILTFISLLGLLGLYFMCPRGRRLLRRAGATQQQLEMHHEIQQNERQQQNKRKNSGLRAEEINRLPLLSFQEAMGMQNAGACAVCLGEFVEELEDEEQGKHKRSSSKSKNVFSKKWIRFLPQCNHCFHPECVDKWLQTSASCPLCRSNLKDPQPDHQAQEEDAAPANSSSTAAVPSLPGPQQDHIILINITTTTTTNNNNNNSS